MAGGFFERGREAETGISMVSVPVGRFSKMHIPVAQLKGAREGKKLLVIGGMNGDEYEGVEAAYRLCKEYRQEDFAGELVVIPICNMLGFQSCTAYNPPDALMPHHDKVFPGRKDGSATERLLYWLTSAYGEADGWVELHSGSLTESLNPFLWLYQTGYNHIDALAEEVIAASDLPVCVYERVGAGTKQSKLAKRGCLSVLSEAGERGAMREDDIARHMANVRCIMETLGMLPHTQPRQASRARVVRSITYVTAPFDGIFRSEDVPFAVECNQRLGSCSRYDSSVSREIRAPEPGYVLWRKSALSMKKRDILYAIGTPS